MHDPLSPLSRRAIAWRVLPAVLAVLLLVVGTKTLPPHPARAAGDDVRHATNFLALPDVVGTPVTRSPGPEAAAASGAAPPH